MVQWQHPVIRQTNYIFYLKKVHLQAKVYQPHPLLPILVLIQKADLFKSQRKKSVFTTEREKKLLN